jgi:glycosyltransferase involved in cell wall biosynthesis
VIQPRSDLRVVGFRYHPAIGGAEHLARRLTREIGDRMRVDIVTVVTDNRSDWLRLLVDGVRDTEERYQVDGRDVRALARWAPDVRRRLRRLVPLYHLPRSPASALMGMVLAEPLDSVPRGAALIHNIFMGREAFSLGLMIATHKAGLPFVFTPLRHERPFGWSSPAFQQLYIESDAVIALTRTEADWLIAHGARPERVSVIGGGPLSDPTATPQAARQLLGEDAIVLFLGQLHSYKGFETVLRAAEAMRDRRGVRFVFAGPDIRGHARKFEKAPPNVTYLAAVDDALRDSLLQACTVLCVPSSRESFGIVLVEAWNAGKPVIGGPAAATSELIEDGVDGWSIPQQPAALVRRLTELLDDPARGRQMGAAGKAKADRRFSWPAIADAHLAVYSRLVTKSSSR